MNKMYLLFLLLMVIVGCIPMPKQNDVIDPMISAIVRKHNNIAYKYLSMGLPITSDYQYISEKDVDILSYYVVTGYDRDNKKVACVIMLFTKPVQKTELRKFYYSALGIFTYTNGWKFYELLDLYDDVPPGLQKLEVELRGFGATPLKVPEGLNRKEVIDLFKSEGKKSLKEGFSSLKQSKFKYFVVKR